MGNGLQRVQTPRVPGNIPPAVFKQRVFNAENSIFEMSTKMVSLCLDSLGGVGFRTLMAIAGHGGMSTTQI